RDAEPRVLARNDRHVAVPELLARLESGDQVELVKAVEAREAALQTDDVEQLAGLGKLQAARKEIALRICDIADGKLAEPPLDEQDADDAFADLLRRDQRSRGDDAALVIERIDLVGERIQVAEIDLEADIAPGNVPERGLVEPLGVGEAHALEHE